MFSNLDQIVHYRHEHARRLKKEQGEKIIGYLCSYVPEELIYAGGAIPVRLFSSEEPPTLADNFMQLYYCPFARSILHQGLKGDYDYLDGLVWAYTCTTMKLAFDSWRYATPLPYMRWIHMPCATDTPEAKDFYIAELRRFRRDLEEFVGHPITDHDLRQAIQTYDTNRSLVMQLFEYRKRDVPLLTGTESFVVTLSSMLTDKASHNAALAKLLQEVPQRQNVPHGVGRLMIVGSPQDNLGLLKLVEAELGGIIVTDDTCTGTRYVYGTSPLSPDCDPIEAIADRYLTSRAPCPAKYSPTRWQVCWSCPYRAVECFMMTPKPRNPMLERPIVPPVGRACRFRHMLQLAFNHEVEGVLAATTKFCDSHGFDYHHVAQLFEGVGVPVLFIEQEQVISPAQIRTRVQAFLEMLEPVEYIIEERVILD